ncbi:MAG: TIGR03435 family protein [Acidobacteriota bacterium]
MKTFTWILATAVLVLAQGQAQEHKLAFEVATIKPTDPDFPGTMISGMGPGPSGGRFTARGIRLRQLIILAYADSSKGPVAPGGPGLPVTGAPSWISTDRYDIEARPESGFTPTLAQSQEMLRTLLEDRFHLKARREIKNGPIYLLVVAKNGIANKAGLRKSADQSPVVAAPPPGQGPPESQSGATPPRGLMTMGLAQMHATDQTMDALAGILTVYADRRVFDRTDLAGLYDFELKFTPDQTANATSPPPGAAPPQVDPNGPSLFTAIQEQLGLKLESATGPLDSIVVEAVERPTAN